MRNISKQFAKKHFYEFSKLINISTLINSPAKTSDDKMEQQCWLNVRPGPGWTVTRVVECVPVPITDPTSLSPALSARPATPGHRSRGETNISSKQNSFINDQSYILAAICMR